MLFISIASKKQYSSLHHKVVFFFLWIVKEVNQELCECRDSDELLFLLPPSSCVKLWPCILLISSGKKEGEPEGFFETGIIQTGWPTTHRAKDVRDAVQRFMKAPRADYRALVGGPADKNLPAFTALWLFCKSMGAPWLQPHNNVLLGNSWHLSLRPTWCLLCQGEECPYVPMTFSLACSDTFRSICLI